MLLAGVCFITGKKIKLKSVEGVASTLLILGQTRNKKVLNEREDRYKDLSLQQTADLRQPKRNLEPRYRAL